MVCLWFFPALWIVFIAVWIAMARRGKVVAERRDLSAARSVLFSFRPSSCYPAGGPIRFLAISR